jgi:hypothetical protein
VEEPDESTGYSQYGFENQLKGENNEKRQAIADHRSKRRVLGIFYLLARYRLQGMGVRYSN